MTGASAGAPTRGYQAATFSLFSTIAVINLFDMILPGALINPIIADWNITDTDAARIMTAFTIAYLIGAPIHGYLGDRYPRKPIILAGLVLWSFASIGSGYATGLVSLLIWRALVGFGEGTFRAHQNSWLADTFRPDQRGTVFSIFSGLGSIAFALAFILGSALAERYGWRSAFIISGIPGLITAFLLLRLREPARGALDTPGQMIDKPGMAQVRALILSYPFILYALGSATLQFAFSNANFWGSVHLHREFGISNREAAQFWGWAYLFLGFGGAALFGILATRLIRRIGNPAWYALFGVIATGAGAVAMAMALQSPTIGAVKFWFAIEVLVSTAFFGSQALLLLEIVPIQLRGTAAALAFAFSLIAANVLKSEVVGRISDTHGLATALWLIPVAFTLSALAWGMLALRMNRTRTTDPGTMRVATR
ncbi:MFS transporter [Sphingomonas colocasiae]|uniref:MFS transporter n=1 Tax=Sphingomonas colocasiae TaxID=1848973 RepID=A0ABS7PHI4_9SPHN|nr:MFS transporter [Sphingomonas colocasiae]MBY8820762.1 MFS transporter [Sphingomonas colocasiae]